MTKHQKQACCKEKLNELRSIDSEVLNLQACLFVLEPNYSNIEIEAGLMSQPLFIIYLNNLNEHVYKFKAL